jgi:hypothetical protein
LQAGKHVLLEKAFTVNAAQARVLVEVAQAKNCFLMEALWTRFFPLTMRVRELILEGAIGKVQRVVADRSLGRDIEVLYGTEHRLINANLAGGALLDCRLFELQISFLIDSGAAKSVCSGYLLFDMGISDSLLSAITRASGAA